MRKWYTVNDLYKYTSENNVKLLSDFNATFWADYKTNYQTYDLLFNRLFKNFRYFDQDIEDELTAQQVATQFIAQVNAHLLLNKKRYEEIYRINVLTDNDYNIFNNLSVSESHTGSSTNSSTNTLGSRSDSTSYTSGSRSDTSSSTEGQRQDSTSTTLGQRSDTTEEQVSAYNVATYQNANKTTLTKGQESDSTSLTKGSQSNSESFTKGQQQDSETFNKGQEIDSLSGSASETKSITRTGKLSLKSNAQVIDEHMKTWGAYEYYGYIFNDIAKELLLV